MKEKFRLQSVGKSCIMFLSIQRSKKMRYLFCTDITNNINNETTDGECLQTGSLPQTMREQLRQESIAYDRTMRRFRLPEGAAMGEVHCVCAGADFFTGHSGRRRLVRAGLPQRAVSSLDRRRADRAGRRAADRGMALEVRSEEKRERARRRPADERGVAERAQLSGRPRRVLRR